MTGNLQAAFEGRKAILDWEENWDGEGSLPASKIAWGRAYGYMEKLAQEMWVIGGREMRIGSEDIGPYCDGSVDVSLDEDGYALLVNVDPDLTVAVSYYGEHKDGTGEIRSGDGQSLARWLSEAQA